MRTLFILILTLVSSSSFCQNSTSNCYNGKQDSTEAGVDCTLNQNTGCFICNGSATYTFNGKTYMTGIIEISNEQTDLDEYSYKPFNKINKYFVVTTRFYTEGNAQSGFSVIIKVPTGKLDKDKYKLKVDKNCIIFYHRSGLFVFKKIKNGAFTVLELNTTDRKFSGTVELEGTLTDGTSVSLTGTLTNVNY